MSHSIRLNVTFRSFECDISVARSKLQHSKNKNLSTESGFPKPFLTTTSCTFVNFILQEQPNNMEVDAEDIKHVAKKTLCWPENRKWESRDLERRIRSFFGAPSETIALIWNLIWNRIRPDERSEICKRGTGEPQCHCLLCALLFLKVCASKDVHCSIVGWPSVKTFRKWSWCFIEKIADLKDDIIQLERRFEDIGDDVQCFVSVDGTDCPVFEPWPFDKKMFSFKTNGPALRCEVAVAISTGFIVWVNGPFRAGKPDSKIFKEGLRHCLLDDERVEVVDGGHRGDDKFMTPGMGNTSQSRKQKSVICGRHENVNSRLKMFNVTTSHF